MVSSCILKGSVLGLVLFSKFINDLKLEVSSEVAKSTDDSKLYNSVRTMEALQLDL